MNSWIILSSSKNHTTTARTYRSDMRLPQWLRTLTTAQRKLNQYSLLPSAKFSDSAPTNTNTNPRDSADQVLMRNSLGASIGRSVSLIEGTKSDIEKRHLV